MMPFRYYMLSLAKSLYTFFLVSLLFFDAYFLGLSQEQLIVALLGSASGSFILNYYRKSNTYIDGSLKIIGSSIGGLFIGAAVAKYLNIEAMQYFGACFFITSFLILTFLHALLSVTDSNAKTIITRIVRGFTKFDGEVVEEKTRIETTEVVGKAKTPALIQHEAEVSNSLDRGNDTK